MSAKVYPLVGLVTLLLVSLSWGGQVHVEFKKALWPSIYYLVINNRNSDRAVEFQGGWEDLGAQTDYYAVMNDESRYYFSSPSFEEIGAKGRLWVYPGRKITIPFKLSKNIVKNAQRVVFNGLSFILEEYNGHIDQKDLRALTIIYNVAKRNFEILISDEQVRIEDQVRRFGDKNFNTVIGREKQLTIDKHMPSNFKAINVDNFGRTQE